MFSQSGACLSPRGESRGRVSLQVIRAEETRHDVGCELGSEILFLNFVCEQEHTSVQIQIKECVNCEEFFQTRSRLDVRCPCCQFFFLFSLIENLFSEYFSP